LQLTRSDRDSKEGFVLAKVTSDNKRGVVLAVNCENRFRFQKCRLWQNGE
jgi:translation elongation factor EF-Ts